MNESKPIKKVVVIRELYAERGGGLKFRLVAYAAGKPLYEKRRMLWDGAGYNKYGRVMALTAADLTWIYNHYEDIMSAMANATAEDI